MTSWRERGNMQNIRLYLLSKKANEMEITVSQKHYHAQVFGKVLEVGENFFVLRQDSANGYYEYAIPFENIGLIEVHDRY